MDRVTGRTSRASPSGCTWEGLEMAEDDPDFADDLPPDEAKKLKGLVPDIVRRAVLTGVGALFMTEEGIRNLVGEMKLPEDALAFLLSQAEKTRAEVARVGT